MTPQHLAPSVVSDILRRARPRCANGGTWVQYELINLHALVIEVDVHVMGHEVRCVGTKALARPGRAVLLGEDANVPGERMGNGIDAAR